MVSHIINRTRAIKETYNMVSGVASRGVGTGGSRGARLPPSFAKCPFSGSKVPFSCVKNVIKIAFFDQSVLLKTWIYVISGKMFSFPGKISYIRKFFWYIRKVFFVFKKKCGIYGKFFWDDRKIFLRWPPTPPPPVANISGGKFLGALFYSKSAPQSLPPPQLLEASYAPGA